MNNIVLNKITTILVIIFLIIISFFIFNKLLIIILPFYFGYLISKIFVPITNKSRLKNNYLVSFLTFLLILIFISLVSGILFFIGRSFIEFLSTKIINNDAFRTQTLYYYNQLISNTIKLPFDFKLNIDALLENSVQEILNFLVNKSQMIVESSFRFLVFLPEILVFIIITFISAFFFTKDSKLIRKNIQKYINPYTEKIKSNKYYQLIMKDVFFVLFGYLKAQLILMSFTFIITAFALGLLRIENFLFKALAISLVDALPIFGTAIILIPWAIINFLSSKVFIATALLVLYLVLTIFRQSIEPKIFSVNIGLYPLITLFSIYAGLKTIGVMGIFVGPILVIITKTMFKYKNTNV